MREALIAHLGRRHTFRARVVRLGSRPRLANVREATVLLADVTDAMGVTVCGHVWLPLGKRLAAVGPRPGDVLAFTATVRPYRKGRIRRPDGTIGAGTLDYKLALPAAVRTLERGTP